MTTPKASSRDQWGRRLYPIPHPVTRELVDLPSWTTLKKLLYSGGLETWKLKLVAAAVAGSTSLQMMAADPETTYKAVRQAFERKSDAADIGTMVHKMAEAIDRDTLDWSYVADVAKPWLYHYLDAAALFGWQMVEAEVTVSNHTLGYAGTVDRFMRFETFPGGPTTELNVYPDDVFVVDLKTGKDVHAETALQLAAYANGEAIFEPLTETEDIATRRAALEADIANGTNVPPGRRKWSADAIKQARAELDEQWLQVYAAGSTFRPMPAGLRTDIGFVIHLTADGCRLIPLRLDGAVEVVGSLCQIYAWQARNNIVGTPIGGTGSAQVDTAAPPPADDLSACEGLSVATAVPEERTLRVEGDTSDTGPAMSDRRTLEIRIDWLKTHSPPAARELAQWWVHSDVPTFKSGQPITDAELRCIEQRMNEIEAKHGVTFGPAPFEVVQLDEAIERLEAVFNARTEDPNVDELRQTLMTALNKIGSTQPHLIAKILEAKQTAGLTKRLRHDDWTADELLALGRIITAVAGK